NSCPEVITRTYEISDSCGGVVNCQQLIIINDTISPTADALPILGPFVCYSEIPPSDINDVTGETDNCGTVTVSYIGESPDPGCAGIVTRTYQIEDICGNTSEINQTILILDSINPVFVSVPNDTTTQCDIPPYYSSYSEFAQAGGLAIDNCSLDTSSFTYAGEVINTAFCPLIITRTYRIYDDCGNVAEFDHIITVNDTTSPEITCPPDTLIQPGKSVPAAFINYNEFVVANGYADDNCEIDESSFMLISEDSVITAMNIEITRTYQVADLCGNTTSCSQIIDILLDAETTITCPETIIVECPTQIPPAYNNYSEFIFAGGAASSNCGIDENTFSLISEVNDSLTCPETISRTYEITDSCNNTVSCIQLIVVNDTTNPEITCPTDTTILPYEPVPGAFADYTEFINAGGTVSDNCGINESSFALINEDTIFVNITEVITRTYQIADLCGNLGSCTQITTVMHDAEESITCPPTITVECPEQIPTAYSDYLEFVLAGGSATSKCGINESSFAFISEARDSLSCPETITRTYEITDTCNNIITCTQLIIINDVTAPVLTCAPDTSLLFDEVIPAPYANYNELVIASIPATDNCAIDENSLQLLSETTTSEANLKAVTRLYQIADLCGNTATCSQKLTISLDAEAQITCPTTITVECLSDVPTEYTDYDEFINAGGLASSNCGINASTFTLASEVYDGLTCQDTIARTYQITDSCGNSVTCTQFIIIDDITNPVISCPAVIDIQPNEVVPGAYTDYSEFITDGGTASDNCELDQSSFALISETSVINGDYEEITRTYQIADMCGNTTSCTQLISVLQNADAQINCPANLTFQCKDDVPAPYTDLNSFIDAGGSASSNCGLIPGTFELLSEENNNRTCPEIITRTYSIEDACGNVVTCRQIITVDDNTPPRFTSTPRNLFSDCNLPAPYANYTEFRNAGGEASDNCELVTSSFRLFGQVVLTESCPRNIRRTYIIFDACGNPATFSQTITLNDLVPPIFESTPKDIIVECEAPEPYNGYQDFVNAGGSVSDNCGVDVNSFVLLNSQSTGGCPDIITRDYRISDFCGNSIVYTQTITVHDVTDPEFTSVPENITTECSIPLPYQNYSEFRAAGGQAKDNCGIDENSFTLSSSESTGSCPEIITRTYRVSDLCGNTTAFTQIITKNDTTPPQITCNKDYLIGPNEAIPPAITSFAEFIAAGWYASDNCGINESSFRLVSEISDGNSCPEIITRIYEVADSCNNTASCSQRIIINDDTPPEIICPENVTVQCIDEVPPAYTNYEEFTAANGSAYDDFEIDEGSFRMVSEVSDGTACPATITRTYEISDLCNNTAVCYQQITIADTIAPEFSCPDDLEVECYSQVPAPFTDVYEFIAAGGIATDNCGITDSSFNMVSEVLNDFTRPRVISRTYEIYDQCNNVSICTQTITITDSIAPVAICNNINVSIDTNGSHILSQVDLIEITKGSTDNCGVLEDLSLSVFPSEFDCSHIGTPQEVQVSLTDLEGNSSTCSAFVEVNDVLPPVTLCKDITVYLDKNGSASITKHSVDDGTFDNCGLQSMFIDKSYFDCNDIGDNTVNLTAIDIYTLIGSCSANVAVVDSFAPTALCKDVVVKLDETNTAKLATTMVDDGSFDECGIGSMQLDVSEFDCNDIGNTVVSMTVTDYSLNSSTCLSNVTITGNEAPEAIDDYITVSQNKTSELNITQNDFDNDGELDFTSVTILSSTRNGTASYNLDTHTITYIPNTGFTGYDSLIYIICDDGIPCGSLCDTAKVYIDVRQPGIAPVANDDEYVIGCKPIIEDMLANDYDPDRDNIAVNQVPVIDPMHGTLTIYADGTFNYQPDEGFLGLDTFVYEICDDGFPVKCGQATVRIVVADDYDCDGVPDIDDVDDDDDGILDVMEGDRSIDTDGDGIPNSLDIDADNDGIVDNIEGQGEFDYIPPLGKDTDGDGWDDAYDPDNNGTPFDPIDTDGDTIADYLDLDADNDNVPDSIEGHDINADGIADILPYGIDSDQDGLDDAYDIVNWNTNRANGQNPIGSNSPLQDFDHDGTRDWRDVDDDADNILTKDEDNNGDGDYSNDDMDLDGHPDYLDVDNTCSLYIPEGFSPNGDGVHDYFRIYCIENYPDAKMYIFNRWGNKIFEKIHYGNLDYWGSDEAAWWDGSSKHKWSLGSQSLPPGNYLYILDLGNGEKRSGTVMISN
ncbi:MAG: T9SS type B sorting domain-containing protein, partial [Chlorobi bacterium]|nr:T9SS type B sorting domain-containing protein [Chlorobiota bacterium]